MPDERNRDDAPETEPWFDRAFRRHYLDLYAHRNPHAARVESAFAVRALGLAPGRRVLDLGSGPGYHLAELRRAGLDAFGLDRSRDLARCAPDRGACVRGDLRRLPFAQAFDAVLAFYTVLGYFDDEEENRTAFREIGRVLRPGGRVLVDHLNADLVRRTLVPASERIVGNRTVRETRWIEEDPPRVMKRVEAAVAGRETEVYTESVRLYGPEELAEALRAGGVEAQAVYGDFDGGPHGPATPRTILTGRKGP
jgi:SAM-dependent methyltransferase